VVPPIGGKSQDLPRLFVVIRKIQKHKAFYRPYNHYQFFHLLTNRFYRLLKAILFHLLKQLDWKIGYQLNAGQIRTRLPYFSIMS